MARRTLHDVRGDAPAVRSALERLPSPDDGDVRTAGGVLAAAAVCLVAVVRTVVNAPLGESSATAQSLYTIATTTAIVVPGVAAVAVGVVADTEWELVGLVAAGLFALLAAGTRAATVPAVGVLVVTSVLVVVPSVATGEHRTRERMLFGVFVLASVGLSLGASTGLLPSRGRSLGTVAALATLVVAPLVTDTSGRALGVGLVAAVLTGAGVIGAPFVSGAVLLTVWAAIGPNVVLVALGVGGVVAVVVAGAARRQTALVSGALLLLAAGVPATVPRGLAVVLGAHLLLNTTTPGATGEPRGGEPS